MQKYFNITCYMYYHNRYNVILNIMKNKQIRRIYIELIIGWLIVGLTAIPVYILDEVGGYIALLFIIILMVIATTIGCYILDEISKKKPN